MIPTVPPACSEPCPDGCDLACERKATWHPAPGAALILGKMSAHGVRFVVDATGGGVLFGQAKGKFNQKINRRVGSVRPWRGE